MKLKRFNWFERWVLKKTQRLWHRYIDHIFQVSYSVGLINSFQSHILASEFDSTQHKIKFHLKGNDMLFGTHDRIREKKRRSENAKPY